MSLVFTNAIDYFIFENFIGKFFLVEKIFKNERSLN